VSEIGRHVRGVVLVLVACLLPQGKAAAQEPSRPRNAFAGFETIILPNGLKVWFQRLPGDPTVSVSISVSVGSDQDPPGLEELAHFTEHMLFSDHLGRSEEQIKREIESRGGTYNGFTTPDQTFYYARIGKAHGPFALEWLYRLVSPHAIDPAVVERQRRPVAVEVGAQPRQLGDWLWAAFVDPPVLRIFNFWRNEFGLETRDDRDYYPYRSLTRIFPEDLRRFYETYYAPSNMTLTVIGDRTEALRLVGTCAWVTGKQGKALRFWSESIRLGERLGARLELGRTWAEVGTRLLEGGSRSASLDGVSASEYQSRAEAFFKEKGLSWDLDRLRELSSRPGSNLNGPATRNF
jgi:hypothetical protein